MQINTIIEYTIIVWADGFHQVMTNNSQLNKACMRDHARIYGDRIAYFINVKPHRCI